MSVCDFKIFDSTIKIKDTVCKSINDDDEPCKPYVNLYIRLTNICQANCLFCEFHGRDKVPFEVEKMKRMVTELSQQIWIGKVSLTGGEPTLNIDMFESAATAIRGIHKNIFIGVNTNGIHLSRLDTYVSDGILTNVALSRHHYDEEVNAELFQMKKSPSSNDVIKKFKNKDKLHLSCNMIKGYIDNNDGCFDYMNFYSDLGVKDCGFVSLMSVNDYCRKNMIDFESLDYGSMKNTINSRQYRLDDICKCNNYVTICDKENVMKSYMRRCVKPLETPSILVYEDGLLRNNFNGPVVKDYN